jgi:hypothetical protein
MQGGDEQRNPIIDYDNLADLPKWEMLTDRILMATRLGRIHHGMS